MPRREKTMTPEDVSQVQQSFRSLLPYTDELAEAFLLRLAKAEPALAPLFPAGSAAHRRRIVATLAFAIEALDDPANMADGLAALGAACRQSGIGRGEIATIRAALIDTVRQALGGSARQTRWTPELRAAWEAAAASIAAAIGGRETATRAAA